MNISVFILHLGLTSGDADPPGDPGGLLPGDQAHGHPAPPVIPPLLAAPHFMSGMGNLMGAASGNKSKVTKSPLSESRERLNCRSLQPELGPWLRPVSAGLPPGGPHLPLHHVWLQTLPPL